MAKRREEKLPFGMDMMGLLLFDEEDSKLKIDGKYFDKILIVFSLVLFIISAVFH